MSWLLLEKGLELPESTSSDIHDGQGGRGPSSQMHSCFYQLFCGHADLCSNMQSFPEKAFWVVTVHMDLDVQP